MAAVTVPTGEEAGPPGGATFTMALVALWYAASVVCNQTSKALLRTFGAQSLTLAQLVVSSLCGAAVLLGLRLCCSECVFPPVAIGSREQLFDTTVLAAAFTGGFITLNACLNAMHVSLVMVLRAAEPLTTLAIGCAFFGARVSPGKAAALLPIVAGCALSAVGPFQSTAVGLSLATLSNVCFSLRGLLGKRLRARYGTGALESFFQLCTIGAALQAVLLLATSGPTALWGLSSSLLPIGVGTEAASSLGLVLINGASFYAYLQLSWICLGRMSAVSHSVANSLRRPVTVIAALLYAPVALSPTNLVGIAVACAAAAAYGLL
jgi:hypothetical protein